MKSELKVKGIVGYECTQPAKRPEDTTSYQSVALVPQSLLSEGSKS